MDYLLVKQLHLAAVATSILLFALRATWMAVDSPRLAARWVRVVPHAVDSVLLASALVLAAMSGQWPFAQAWLTVKVLLLVVYIGLGMLALRPGRPKRVRIVAACAALATVLFIVSVARGHDPWGAFAPLLH